MRKLLSANLSLLRKNGVFWLGMAVMLAVSAINMLNGCRQAAADRALGYGYALDNYYFGITPVAGIFFAVFMSLFLGTEYNDGTIRNKVIVGHTRKEIYLANLLTCMLASLGFLAALFLGGCVGIPFLGIWKMEPLRLLLYLLVSVFFSAALTAVFNWIGMLCSNKAAGAVISLLLYLGLLIWGSMLYNKLCQPELISGIVITAEGMQVGDPAPNPDYISGSLRAVYEEILNILPTGQMILMANLEILRPVFQMAASAVITLAVSISGVILFEKKDLK